VRDEELLPRISESWWYDIFVHRVVFDLNPKRDHRRSPPHRGGQAA